MSRAGWLNQCSRAWSIERPSPGDLGPLAGHDLHVGLGGEQLADQIGPLGVAFDAHDSYAGPAAADQPGQADTTTCAGLTDNCARATCQYL
ncbi:hypothetical protein [Kribbella deserti]|uniref:Uncharacterized protein n=1 Tax=Kribbella deserti TaxID=1926257 RepID=A0ABV6QIY8_9ACTN